MYNFFVLLHMCNSIIDIFVITNFLFLLFPRIKMNNNILLQNDRLLDFNSRKILRIELNNTTAKKLMEVYKYLYKEKGRGRRGTVGSLL
jgi:hypothetical protein